METIRFGVIGTGMISDRFADAVKATPDCEILSVYSRGTESGEAYARRHGIESVCTSLDALLSSGIDAVYVASPNLLHFSQSMAALDAGLHVLCEKPAVPTAEEYLALSQRATDGGLVLLEAMRPLHDPVLALIKETLPRLGRIRHAVLEYCQYSSRYDAFLRGEVKNAFNPNLANAAVMDIGIYPIELCVSLFGAPHAVFSGSVFLENGFEGEGMARLSYDGMQALILYSKITDSVRPSVITGEHGSLSFLHANSPQELSLHLRGEAPTVIPYAPVENNMIYELAEFCRLIRGRVFSHPYAKISEESIRIVEKIRACSGISFDV
ncbi:MAG: Gfo/Idh/MocA family oxidoreductase [Clostridia bacterium]|nr:Gfo/Idh/MocA family oxidoreductase [Clostridia bacterium]